jgi:hypothetical protein
MTPGLRVLRASDDDADASATLSLISQARRSLADALALPDVRRVIEATSVLVDAAQRAAKLAQAQHAAAEVVQAASQAANDAAALRIEAQAKAGELLRAMAESGERKRSAETYQPGTSLGDLGITRNESSRWQRVAAIPPDVRAEYVAQARTAGAEVSTAGLLRHRRGKGPVHDPVASPARSTSTDHPAIAAEARKRMRSVHRVVVALSGYRPESLVSALDHGERRDLLRAVGQLPGWIEDVRRELAIHRVSEEE